MLHSFEAQLCLFILVFVCAYLVTCLCCSVLFNFLSKFKSLLWFLHVLYCPFLEHILAIYCYLWIITSNFFILFICIDLKLFLLQASKLPFFFFCLCITFNYMYSTIVLLYFILYYRLPHAQLVHCTKRATL